MNCHYRLFLLFSDNGHLYPPSIHQTFLHTHTWIAIKIHPATLSHRLLINQWNVTVVAGVFSKRFNLCTIFTRRMIEGEKKKGGKKERERSWVYNNNNNNEVNVFWAPRVTAKVPSSNTLNKIVFIASPTSVYRVQWRHCRFSNVKTIKQNRNLCRDGGKITGRNRNQRCAIVVYHVWCIPNSIYSSAPRLFLTETDKVEERKFWWSLLPDKWCQNSMRFACRLFWIALV